MKARVAYMVLGMFAILGLALAPVAAAAELVVVATPSTFAKSANWAKFLDSKDIPVKNVAPSDLAGFKDAPYLVLMGGMDEAGGIKPLAEKALSKSEFDRMTMPSSSAMYVKSDVWKSGQEVILFLGATDAGVDTARKSNRAEWMDIILGWFGIENETTGRGGTPSY
jgi:hypothetical protein